MSNVKTPTQATQAVNVVLRMPTTEGEETATVRRDVETLLVRRIRLCFGQTKITVAIDLRQGQALRWRHQRESPLPSFFRPD